MEKATRQRCRVEISKSTHAAVNETAQAMGVSIVVLADSIFRQWLAGPRVLTITPQAKEQSAETKVEPQQAEPEPWTPSPMDYMIPSEP